MVARAPRGRLTMAEPNTPGLVIEVREIGGVRFALQHVLDRKGRKSRNPYWYGFAARRGGRFKCVYIGRREPGPEDVARVLAHVPLPRKGAEVSPITPSIVLASRCPLCGGSLVRTVASSAPCPVIECSGCGHRWSGRNGQKTARVQRRGAPP